MRIRFWGVRGTIPTPGLKTVRYGGNTACIEILTTDQQVIIIDAGTGIRGLGQLLQREHPQRITGCILISHTHWDHIQGFPFFKPVFGRHNRFVLVGRKRVDQRLEAALAGQFTESYLPFGYKTLPADLLVKEVKSGEKFIIGESTIVKVADLNHPGGSLGFRIEDKGSTFVYCSDTGHYADGFTESVLELAQGADFLVHDSHFATVAEARQYAEWGHSCWLESTQIAIEANVNCLGLFHYSPDLSDDELDNILLEARKMFPRTILTREGMVVNLPVGIELPM